MINFLQRLRKEFKTAPLWEKAVLVVLSAVIFYFFLMRPGLVFTEAKLSALDNKRDIAFKQVQAAKYLIADEKIISENYRDICNRIAPDLASEQVFIVRLKQIFKKHAVKVYALEMPDAGRMDFNGLGQIHIQARVRLTPTKVRVIIEELTAIPYGVLTSFDYKESLGLIEADFLVNHTYPVKQRVVAPAKKQAVVKTKVPDFVINGFFVSGSKKQVIINGRVFNVGGKYGPYTIISITPETKSIKVSLGKKVMVKYYKKGK